MINEIKIGNKTIGENSLAFIIAEAGSNHDGDLEQAKKLIDVAVEAGADAVKFQTFTADKIAARTDDEIMILGMSMTLPIISMISIRAWNYPGNGRRSCGIMQGKRG